MIRNLLKLILLTAFAGACSLSVSAQFGSEKEADNDVTKTFQETLVKQRIDREKKDYQEMLERGSEVLQISSQLEKAHVEKTQVSPEDLQKLDRLEKLLKKIRTELGANGDGGDDDSPDARNPDERVSADKPPNAFEKLQSLTADFADKLKTTTRFSISVAAIQSSNALLKMVRFLRLKQ